MNPGPTIGPPPGDSDGPWWTAVPPAGPAAAALGDPHHRRSSSAPAEARRRYSWVRGSVPALASELRPLQPARPRRRRQREAAESTERPWVHLAPFRLNAARTARQATQVQVVLRVLDKMPAPAIGAGGEFQHAMQLQTIEEGYNSGRCGGAGRGGAGRGGGKVVGRKWESRFDSLANRGGDRFPVGWSVGGGILVGGKVPCVQRVGGAAVIPPLNLVSRRAGWSEIASFCDPSRVRCGYGVAGAWRE